MTFYKSYFKKETSGQHLTSVDSLSLTLLASAWQLFYQTTCVAYMALSDNTVGPDGKLLTLILLAIPNIMDCLCLLFIALCLELKP